MSIELRLVLWAPLILAAILTAPDPDLFGRLVFAADALRDGLPEIDPYFLGALLMILAPCAVGSLGRTRA